MSLFDKAMKEVLSQSKYDYLNGKWDSILETIAQWIFKALEAILKKLDINFDASTLNYNTKAITGIFIVIAVIIAVIIIAITIYLLNKRKKRSKAVAEIFDEYRSTSLSFDELINLSREYELSGNFGQTLRYQYIALIMSISQANIIFITDSMTGGQFMRLVSKGAPQFYAGVKSTVNMYYLLHFGNKNVSQADYLSHKSLFNETVKEVLAYEEKV